jgi:hypothetical protein
MILPKITTGLAVAISLFAAFAPSYAGSGPSKNLVQVNGIIALVVLIPITVSLLGFATEQWVRILGAVLMLAFCLIGAAAIGLFYLPVAILMFVQGFIKREAA